MIPGYALISSAEGRPSRPRHFLCSRHHSSSDRTLLVLR